MGSPVEFMFRRSKLGSLLLWGVLGLLCTESTGTAAPAPIGAEDTRRPTNVVIFYLDDIGTEFYRLFDSVNAYGPGLDPFTNGIYVQTPVLDSLAANGVVFTSAYATPVCSPGRASLLTGNSQLRTGVGTLIRHDFIGRLAEFGDPGFDSPTLADLAHLVDGEAGIIGKWHLGLETLSMSPEFGHPKFLGWEGIAQRGHWDDVRCTFGNLKAPSLANGQPGSYYNFEWYDNGRLSLETGTYVTTLQITEALDFCQNAQEPFIAYVAPNAVHFPLEDLPPAELVNTPAYLSGSGEKVKECQAALEAIDTEIGRFLRGLAPDLRERTMIIVMGDNGTDLPVMRSLYTVYGPLGPTYDVVINSANPRFKHSLYEGGIRVPLVVSWAGIDQPGRISNSLVHACDIFPTVADAWSVNPGDVDGISFMPVLQDAGIGASEHQRQDLRVDFFRDNGDVEHARDHREVAYTRRMADGSRFKLLRQYSLPLSGAVHDSFYLLADGSGAWVDPYELSPLDTDPGSLHRAAYLECALAVAPEERWNYCSSYPNSTGYPARMKATGRASVTDNAFVLEAGPMQPGGFGFFRYSSRAAQVPFGNGMFCLGSDEFGPFNLPFTTATAGGVLRHALDVSSPPVSDAAICAGSTWRFQAFFRDRPLVSSQFSQSDGLAVRWVP